MANLLIFTADDGFAEALTRALRHEGHFCKVAEDEDTALQEVRARGLSLILLDDAPALPKAEEIRNWSMLPILLITEPGRVESMKTPIEADDVLVKPVREEELLFRVRNLCERKNSADADVARTGAQAVGITLDEDHYEIRINGALLDLTFREFELLKHLMQNPGRVFDRNQLLNLVWGVDYIGGPRTVDVHIRRIRAKIEAEGESFITTIRGVGYKFNAAGF
ncbi:MAG: response regulator transcription factor [Nitrospinaceae bacterium]|jgi:DNA-binding response OmpR family regulator|nr:response regulator transcription factor [Nitrospinaceae bacterium]MBT3435300.1 response regulator transcription factor [Nitrospinaceae bacterium]MBT3821125.1 response regulator transcription factor [Nitrospinaceae bacterium]MBT4093607.1 response regulator transcription factor [Nitrospinaceae bacterium]MBT4430405.1 response regulator transcription factor [Nitrospinaceae bacterium]